MLLSRADGRDRVAVPFWNGILSALAALAIGLAALVVATVAAALAEAVATGHAHAFRPGELTLTVIGIAAYGAMAPVAWRRLRQIGRTPFRRPTQRDGWALVAGLSALLVVKLVVALQLTLTHQTKHVQIGFEHFSVTTGVPALTALTILLSVLSMVVIAPLVEELVFRGLLFGALAPRLGVLAGALLSSLLFGLVHGDPVLFPALAGLGFVNALAYAWSGNLTVPVILHALNNALGAAFLIAASLGHRM